MGISLAWFLSDELLLAELQQLLNCSRCAGYPRTPRQSQDDKQHFHCEIIGILDMGDDLSRRANHLSGIW
jgi:hypothetical protein